MCLPILCLRRQRLDPISDEMRSNGLKPVLVPVCMHSNTSHLPCFLDAISFSSFVIVPWWGGLGLVDVSFATTVYYVTTVLLPTSSVFFLSLLSPVSTVFCFCFLRLRQDSTWNLCVDWLAFFFRPSTVPSMALRKGTRFFKLM